VLALKIKRFLHAAVPITRDLQANRVFYERILGFKVDPSRPLIPGIDGYWLNVGDREIQLHLTSHDKQAGPVGGNPAFNIADSHLAFAVENLDECKRQLASEGIPFHETTIVGGRRQVFLRDPSGNLIELQQA